MRPRSSTGSAPLLAGSLLLSRPFGRRSARPIGRLVAIAALLLPAAGARAIWVGDTVAPLAAQAPLQFSVQIDKFVYLQVGSAGPTIDTVRFELSVLAPATAPAGPVAPFAFGSGTPVDAADNGTLRVAVRSNSGTVSLSATNDGLGRGLSNGFGGYIDYAQIITSTDNPGLSPPVLSNAGSTTVAVAGNAQGGRVTNQSANWTFRFANTVLPPSGTYSGQITYTVVSP